MRDANRLLLILMLAISACGKKDEGAPRAAARDAAAATAGDRAVPASQGAARPADTATPAAAPAATAPLPAPPTTPAADDPCRQVTERLCAALGPEDRDCLEAKRALAIADDSDRRACSTMLPRLDEMIATIRTVRASGGPAPAPAPPPTPLPPGTDACRLLAEKVCQQAGENSTECAEMRESLPQVTAADQQVCVELIPQMDELLRLQRELASPPPP